MVGAVALALLIALVVSLPAHAAGITSDGIISPHTSGHAVAALHAVPSERASAARTETLWIFDADFEDVVSPDNLGWTSTDVSGTPGRDNHWHKDTIRINGFEHLGDSTWWCGKYDPCWVQPRGYGNNWEEHLSRDFPLSLWSEPGDVVTFEWDQRFAIEQDYDYAYVDVSDDGGNSWSTVATYSNPGFAGTPGYSQDWDSATYGHPILDLHEYAGADVRIRFRFESDCCYSSADTPNNPPSNPVLDGAWQLDNFEWKVDYATVWADDCEAAGDNGWSHDDVPPTGQVGVTFRRSLETVTGEPKWMMVAYDEATGVMLDGEAAQLLSPPIDIFGANNLVAEWFGWMDLPECSNDRVLLNPGSGGIVECIDPWQWWDWPVWGPYYGGPQYIAVSDEWMAYAGEDWLLVGIDLRNYSPEEYPGCHGKGFMLDRLRIGIPLETSVWDDDIVATALRSPHPNPFNPTATIEYSIASSGHVALRVFSASGRVVRTLVDDDIDAGEYKAIWNGLTDSGDRAASGVYFVRMSSDGRNGCYKEVRKLVLLK
jgi:hypothetical protein